MRVRQGGKGRAIGSWAALWLALLLPWQSFAAIERCDFLQGHLAQHGSLVQSPATDHEQCPEHPAPRHVHHGCCADCCLTAVVCTAFDWAAPRGAAPPLYLPAPRLPWQVSLDRLDRPPRRFA